MGKDDVLTEKASIKDSQAILCWKVVNKLNKFDDLYVRKLYSEIIQDFSKEYPDNPNIKSLVENFSNWCGNLDFQKDVKVQTSYKYIISKRLTLPLNLKLDSEIIKLFTVLAKEQV